MTTTIFRHGETQNTPDFESDHVESSFAARLTALQTMNTKLTCMTDEKVAYEEMIRSAQRVVDCDTYALLIFDPEARVLHVQASAGFPRDRNFVDIDVHEGVTIQSQAFLEEYLVYVPDLQENHQGPRLAADLRSELAIPISCKTGPVGLLDFGSRQPDAFHDQEIRLCSMLVDQVAFSLDNIRLLASLTASRDAVIRGMALLAESRDKLIGRHLDRICAYSRILAERIMSGSDYEDEVNKEFVETLARSAALHDIGKVGIPDTILMKPGKLTPSEFEIMKGHSNIGGSLLEELMACHGSFPTIKMGADVAYGHHEWWDGTGYPRRVKDLSIPLPARIVAICDVFDALTSKRVYKDAWEEPKAYQVIRERAGIQFDPHLVELFCELRPHIRDIRNLFSD